MPTVATKPGIVETGMTARRAFTPKKGSSKVATTGNDIRAIFELSVLVNQYARFVGRDPVEICSLGHRIAVWG